MRIATTKQSLYIKLLPYEALAGGNTSDVWFEEEIKRDEARESYAKQKELKDQ